MMRWNSRHYPEMASWFNQEVLQGRILSSCARSLVLNMFLMSMFLFLLLFSPLTPVSWLLSTFRALLSPSSWLYDLLILGSLAGTSVLFHKHFSLVPFVARNRLSYLREFLDPAICTSFVCHALIGGVLMRCYLGIWGGRGLNSLTMTCPFGERSNCLNEPHLFLVMSGFYIGMSQWFNLHMKNGNLLTFSPIHMHGSSELRLRLWGIVTKAMTDAFWDLRWFYVFYFVSGYRFKYTLGTAFRLDLGDGLDLFSGLLKKLLTVVTAIAFNGFAAVSMRLMWEVSRISLVKPLNLELEDLKEAMKQDKSPLLKYLAFQDFIEVSLGSRERREEVYTLSQPGGHPHNWNHLSDITLKTIEDFTSSLAQSSQGGGGNNRSEQPPQTSAEHKKTDSDPSKSVKPPGLLPLIWNKINKNPLFAPFPDASSRLVFAQSQIVIWASEGLSHIVSMSVFEDRFGVVQKKLPKILTSLLNLQKTVERHKGLTFNARRGGKASEDVRDHQLKQELRTSVKTSLYRIISTFGDDISAVPLSAEFRTKVEAYKNFMEG